MAQLHEHQAKKILSGHGIAIPRGRLAKTAAEASVFAGELGGEVVVKAQVYTTSRAALGGVRFAKTAGESERFAAEMLGSDFAGN